MTIPKRTLTISFDRSITAGTPDTIEVAVSPLSQPSAPDQDMTLVGGTQTQIVVLSNEINDVQFELVPSDSPALAGRVLYRVAWRQRYLGRQYQTDIVMPDVDVNFADLGDLGSIIGGETYIQWSDRGAPGGVAGLNSLGQVIDAEGNPLITEDGDGLSALFTASGGIEKVVVPGEGGMPTTYDFRLAAGSAARKWSGLVIPASGNFGVVDHGLGTTDVLVAVYRVSDRMPMSVTARPNADGDTVAIEFSSPPVTGQYRAVVIG